MEATPRDFQPARYVLIKPKKFPAVAYRHKPRKQPEAPPFDFTDGLKRLALYFEWDPSFPVDPLKIKPGITTEEARFWVECFTNPKFQEPRRVPSLEEITEACRQPLEPWPEFVANRLNRPLDFPKVCGDALFKLFQVEDFLTQWKASFPSVDAGFRAAISFGFRLGWLPYLDQKEYRKFQKLVTERILASPPQEEEIRERSFFLEMACATGLNDGTRPIAKQWLDDLGEGIRTMPYLGLGLVREFIYSLKAPELILHHFRKLDLTITDKEEFAAWLSNIGLDGLDVLERSILSKSKYVEMEARRLCVLFGRSVVAPELAPFMLRLFQSGPFPQIGRNWLKAHPLESIAGLVDLIEAGDPLSNDAAQFLLEIELEGYEEALEYFLSTAHPSVREMVNKLKEVDESTAGTLISATTDPWFEEFLSRPSTVEVLPVWCIIRDLPKVTVEGQPLERPLVVGLLSRLRTLTVENYFESLKDPNWSEIGKKLDNPQINDFLWALFEMWQRSKPDWKDQWVLLSLGIWGNDHTAMKLATAIQNWPATGKLKRAEAALDVLGVIGTPTALAYVQRHALGHQPVVFSRRSKAVYERIAAERGLSTFELDDRIIPDAGLGRHWRRVFDFGSRQFTAELTGELKPVILDAKGKKKRGFPAIEDADDPALAAEAAREWPLFVERIALIRDVQPMRFERALVNGRSWARCDFEKHILGHPVTANLAKRLIWRAFSSDARFIGTFRICEDDSYSDSNDRPFPMPADAVFKLAHRLHLDEPERQRWLQLLVDYFISQPFPQLERNLIAPETIQVSKDRVTEIPDLEVQPEMNEITGNFLLLGWGLTPMLEPSKGKYFFRILDFAGVTALVGFSKDSGPGFSFKECLFLEGKPDDSFFPENVQAMSLKRVDPVVISETLVQIRTASNKGK